MKAEDTVMSDKQILQEYHPDYSLIDVSNTSRRIAKTQAEISFKAGVEQGVHAITQSVLKGNLGKSPEMRAYLDGLRWAGVKEVVEWVAGNDFYRGDDPVGICIEGDNWRAKLKEWGIE